MKLQGFMALSQLHLALSELHSCQAYLSRLFSALLDLSSCGQTKEARKLATLFIHESRLLAAERLFDKAPEVPIIEATTLEQARKTSFHTLKCFESAIQIGIWNHEEVYTLSAELLNIFYQHTHLLHQLIDKETNLEIQYPRVGILDMRETPNNGIPLFQIDAEKLKNFSTEDSQGRVQSLEWQRGRRYEALIQQGHALVTDKEYEEALEVFERARNFKDTAEILTLMAWTLGLSGEIEKAKSLCLKAIQKDPDYGPPYNDLGSYLLQENQYNESLKWFSLAKRSLNYQNREYPYINSGRAYMAKREFKKALEEFSKALALAPFHDELHNTVKRLKNTLEKADWNFTKDGHNQNQQSHQEEQPPLF